MTEQELKQTQDSVLEFARAQLLAENVVRPFVLVFTRKMNVTPEIARFLRTGQQLETVFPADGSNPNDEVQLVLPMTYENDPRGMLDICTFGHESPLAAKEHFDVLRTVAQVHGVANADQHIVNALVRLFKCEPRDLVAQGIAGICMHTAAEAVIKVDEVWHRTFPPEERVRGGLSNDPQSSEAVFVVCESKQFIRTLMLPFTRTERGTGKVMHIGELGDVQVTHDTHDSDATKLGGRFVGFIEGSPAASRR